MKVFFLLIFVFYSFINCSQNLPAKKEILSKMVLANNYFNKKNKAKLKSDLNTVVYFQGLMALNRVQLNNKYLQLISNWAKTNKYELPLNSDVLDADDLAIGSIYIDLYKTDTTKKQVIKAIKTSTDNLVSGYKLDDWSNLSAMYSLMPVLAKSAVVFDQEAYHDKLYQIFIYVKNIDLLYSDQEFLWHYDKTFLPPFKTPKGLNCFWSRGNGFMAAALAAVLDTLPTDAPHYDEYLDTYREMMISLLNLQRDDGFWNVSLTDQDHFGGKELTGTSLITFAMAWGIRNEKIDATTFTPIIAKAMRALLIDAVHPNGYLGWVQGAGKEPKDGQPVTYYKVPDNEPMGLGCFLLAGAEVIKLQEKH